MTEQRREALSSAEVRLWAFRPAGLRGTSKLIADTFIFEAAQKHYMVVKVAPERVSF